MVVKSHGWVTRFFEQEIFRHIMFKGSITREPSYLIPKGPQCLRYATAHISHICVSYKKNVYDIGLIPYYVQGRDDVILQQMYMI